MMRGHKDAMGCRYPNTPQETESLECLGKSTYKDAFFQKEKKSFSTFLSSRKENNVNWRMKDAGEP